MCQMTSLILNFLFYTYLVSKEQKFLCFESKNTKSEMTRTYQCYIIQSNALQITFRPVSFLSIWRKLRLKDILPVANSLNFTTFKLKYKPPLAYWSSVMMYLYLGRQVEMAYSDSCYSSPAGSLSSIPGIAPRQHLGHSSSQQFFKTFAPGKWPPFNSYQLTTILMVMPKKGIENWSFSTQSYSRFGKWLFINVAEQHLYMYRIY